MDWVAGLRKRSKLLVTGILTVSLAAFAVSLLRNPISFDAFWHLRTGQDWVMHGLSPWVDHYSFTFNGEAIRNPPVVFQLILFYAVSLLGIFGGFMAVKAFAQVLTLGATLLFLRSVKARPLLIALVIPCVIVLLQIRSFTRPELISYAFSVIAMLLYFRAGAKVSAANVFPMVLLMLLWTNYHSSIIGYVVFAGFFLDSAVRQISALEPIKEWLQWAAWGLVLLAAGFANHGFVHPVIEAISFPPEWRSHIFEYFAPWPYIRNSPALPILLIVATVTPLLALAQRRFGLLLAWAVLVYVSVTTQRMVAPAGVVVVVMMAGLLAARNFPDAAPGVSVRGLSVAGGLWFLIAVPALYANLALALDILEENRSTYTRYPEALARYMLEEKIEGPVFNDYGIGGFLIYRLAPHNQVYIDGRTHILYPASHLQRFEAIQRYPDLLVQESNRYGFDLLVLPFKQEKHDLAIGTGEFILDYADAGYGLYRKGSGRFPLHGLMLSQPACWDEGNLGRLAAEREVIRASLPFYSALTYYADFVAGYVAATNKQDYFDASFETRSWNDFIRRFVAFRVFESGDYHLARILLGGVETKRTEDYLVSALAMLEAGDNELALQIMRLFSGEDWQSAGITQLGVSLQIWEQLAQRVQLDEPELQFIEGVRNAVLTQGRNPPQDSLELNLAVFCDSAVHRGHDPISTGAQ